MTKFQYFSDVHTEYFSADEIDRLPIKAEAPYLILAGDIGDPFSKVYVRLLERLSDMFQRIFLIAGNHEYYTYSRKKDADWMDSVNARILRVASALPNVTFLNNSWITLEESNITIFGATFWTDVLPSEKTNVATRINDYNLIPCLTIDKVICMHNESREALRNLIKRQEKSSGKAKDNYKDKDNKIVVISHHLPSFELIDPKYRNSGINSAFASDVPEAHCASIVSWVAGHTHFPRELGKFHVNPIGYTGENATVNFNKCFSVLSS
jgi:hypothetical protein